MTTITIADILKKLNDDLAWRGPGGGKLGHIVLNRESAEYLQRWTLLLIHERDDLVAENARLKENDMTKLDEQYGYTDKDE